MAPEATRIALLHLDDPSSAGLTWLRRWARGRITGLKRRRKYLPSGQSYSPAELETLHALLDLEAAAAHLLKG